MQRTPLHLALALASKDVVERPKNSNRGEPIDTWRKAFEIEKPVPWCAVFGSYKSRAGKVKAPVVWSVSARDFAVKGHCWKVSDIVYGRYVPKPGDYRVKTRRGGNHIDMFVTWNAKKKQGTIIGGNVADRVMLRRLSLKRMMIDGTTHITEVKGCYRYETALIDQLVVTSNTAQRTKNGTSTGNGTKKRSTATNETIVSEDADLSES